ncbi:hypothetical protein Tco_0745456 [Tanacetum coccineum]
MSSATSAVTYTSVYTDSEPGRAFWGADDEEVSEGGIPRVIILGYDGLPIQPVAPPSPDYIPGPEDPQTPPVPQDEDEREPMFIPREDPESTGDKHTPPPPQDVRQRMVVDYPMDGGDDGDDDDGDLSRDDANDEDEDEEDEEDEEEEEHLAPADSTTVIPVDEPVFPPEGTEPVIPPPSTDITIGLDSVDPDFHIPSTRGRGREISDHDYSITITTYLIITTLKIASTQALIDAVTAALPSPPLPPLPPSLSIPPPVDRRDDIPESEQPPRKRLYLFTIGSRYEIGESSTARPTRGRGVDYGFVSTVDAEERRQGIRDVGYGIRDTWVDPTEAVPEIAPMTRMLRIVGDIWNGEEEAYVPRRLGSTSIGLSQVTHQELQTHRDHVYAHETYLQAHQTQLQLQSTLIQTQHQVHETRFQMQRAELAALRETDRRRQDQMVETLRVIRDMRREMSDMQAELLALREQQRRARQPGPEARIPDHQDASGDADSHI